MTKVLADPVVEWLLQSADPSVRYLTLTKVIGRPSDDPVVQAAASTIADGPRVRALLSGQHEDGGFGAHPYRKWTGNFWRLIALAELAIPASNPAVEPLVDHVLGWLEGKGRVGPAVDIGGRVRAHATQDGYALAALCNLGLVDHPRIRRIADSLIAWQWPDGGWSCDRSSDAAHSSFHETHGPMWGLAEFVRRTEHREAKVAFTEAAEFLLRHRLFRSERTGETIHPQLLRLRFPPYWHYDLMQGLWVLSRLSKLRDPRATEALDILESRRHPDGCWRADGYWWKRPGSTGSNVEVVDWGRRGPNEWVTLRALRVLKAAGRLR